MKKLSFALLTALVISALMGNLAHGETQDTSPPEITEKNLRDCRIVLSRGDEADVVGWIKNFLVRLHYDFSAASLESTVFDNELKTVIIAFQTKEGFDVNGDIDCKTYTRISNRLR